MNFITKNLGWILLLMFFIFMLFIISSSEKPVNTVGLSSGETLSQTGSIQEKNLDDLIKMIDEVPEENQISDEVTLSKEVKTSQSFFSFLPWVGGKKDNTSKKLNLDLTQEVNISEEVIIIDEELVSQKNISDEVRVDEGEKKGLLSKIFGGKSNENKQEDEKENKAEDTNEKITTAEVSGTVSGRDSFIGAADESSTASGLHIVKNSNKKKAQSTTYLSGVGIETSTKIGDIFNIGVHSLKLNNKYFNETLGYLSRGDTVQQISQENIYGCFEIVVLDAKSKSNTNKKGYVCKKYLISNETAVGIANESENQAEAENEKEINKNTVNSEAITYTSIGSYYKVALEELCFDEGIVDGESTKTVLPQGDILKQVSSFNPLNGCAEMKVVGSAIEANHGKTVSICSPDMVHPVK